MLLLMCVARRSLCGICCFLCIVVRLLLDVCWCHLVAFCSYVLFLVYCFLFFCGCSSCVRLCFVCVCGCVVCFVVVVLLFLLFVFVVAVVVRVCVCVCGVVYACFICIYTFSAATP